MIIPCIDLMGGNVVQLVQGQAKAIEISSVDDVVAMFAGFPLLHIIDLDAALGQGDNDRLVRYLLQRVHARVGGGVRSIERAAELCGLGADKVIVGTAAFSSDGIDEAFLSALVSEVGRSKVVVAIDVKEGHVAIRGWRETLNLTPADVVHQLEPYCEAFLCTYVDDEGTMAGANIPFFRDLRRQTSHRLIAAGGVANLDEVRTLIDANVEVALGMAIYTGRIDLKELRDLVEVRLKINGSS